jgi:hypothetical protein
MIGGKVHSSGHPINGFRQQPDEMLNVLGVFRTDKEDTSPFYGDEMYALKDRILSKRFYR